MMGKVVQEGTGTAAALQGISVAGKTGTAEIDIARNITQPWFIAFAPIENPRVAVAATVERDAGRVRRRGRRADRQGRHGVAARWLSGSSQDAIVDGRYRITGRLGSGGMADVYAAEDLQLGRSVALKLLYRRFAEDAEFVERFRREASSAAGLQHPNVVSVYDRGESDGTSYIAMELIDGRTLKQLVHDPDAAGPARARRARSTSSSRSCARPASPTAAGSSTATSSPRT